MNSFYQILGNSIVAAITNHLVWFALTFWAFKQTDSVLATSVVAGVYLAVTAVSAFWFGSIVDRNKKKTVLIGSAIVTGAFFTLGLLFFLTTPPEAFKTVYNPMFWALVLLLLFGTIVGNIRGIVVPTLVTLLVPDDRRDKANGMVGSAMGISFAVTSAASGVVLSRWGMPGILITSITLTILTTTHLALIPIKEKEIVQTSNSPKNSIDVKGTIRVIAAIPGLFALIFFTTFNNFLGGIFMSLLDAYGLTLVSMETWGYLLSLVSPGFILGGLLIAKYGLGKNPLRTLLLVNLVLWTVCIFFAIQPWIALLLFGMFIWMSLVPFVEAIEQTIIQKVVPYERQGRVFGFAQSVEQAASPLTAFLIGPIAQFIFIPFMTTGAGVYLIGDWFGVGLGRGIALVFIAAGILGLIVTFFAMHSNSYKLLSARYQKK